MSHLRVINTSRGYIHKYENLKGKINNYIANIYLIQQYFGKQFIPTYANIKAPNIPHLQTHPR